MPSQRRGDLFRHLAVFRLLAVASVVAQIVGLFSFGYMMYDIFMLPATLIEQAGGDTARVQQYVLETALSYGAWIASGVIGAILTWLLILKDGYRATWFLATSRVIAWIWMPLFPIGTGLGLLVLRARAAAVTDTGSG